MVLVLEGGLDSDGEWECVDVFVTMAGGCGGGFVGQRANRMHGEVLWDLLSNLEICVWWVLMMCLWCDRAIPPT